MKTMLVQLLYLGESFGDVKARAIMGYDMYILCKRERFIVSAGCAKSGAMMLRVGQRGKEYIEGKIEF